MVVLSLVTTWWFFFLPLVRSQSCNQTNKQKAVYAQPIWDVAGNLGAFEVVNDVIWGNLDGLRLYGKNGIYAATTVAFNEGSPTGYYGVQATGGGDTDHEQVLFSLWDKGDNLALPMSDTCKRNCNDCSDPSLTTGSQCKIFIPANSNESHRLTIRRTASNESSSYNGTVYFGDVFEVTVDDVSVGKLLVANSFDSGVSRISFFNEHIGCVPCEAFDIDESRRGPWAFAENGETISLVNVTSSYDCPECTCKKHTIEKSSSGTMTFTFSSGPSTEPHEDWSDKVIVNCSEDSCEYSGGDKI